MGDQFEPGMNYFALWSRLGDVLFTHRAVWGYGTTVRTVFPSHTSTADFNNSIPELSYTLPIRFLPALATPLLSRLLTRNNCQHHRPRSGPTIPKKSGPISESNAQGLGTLIIELKSNCSISHAYSTASTVWVQESKKHIIISGPLRQLPNTPLFSFYWYLRAFSIEECARLIGGSRYNPDGRPPLSPRSPVIGQIVV
jgi:hypothetical protein